MKPLIIYAHPNKDGHCGEILKQLTGKLKDYNLIDLYKIKYKPILSDKEHYTSKKLFIDKQNKEFQKKIQQTDKLIFIYPTWWQNMPAILKGFIDKVFTPNFAFKYKKGFPIRLLKDKKALVITTCAGPLFYYNYFTDKRSLKVLTKDTLGFCGIKTKGFILPSAKKLNTNIIRINNIVNKALRFLN